MVTKLSKMKFTGKGILNLAFVFGIFFLLIASVSATVTSVSLSSPANDYRTTDSTPTFTFTPKGNITSNSINCTLYIDNMGFGYENALDNSQTTSITASPSLGIGSHTWFIGCVDPENSSNSSSRDFEIIETPDFCDDTNDGDFDITIDDIDSGDEFIVGENISFTVNVENNGDDDFSVYVEVRLYDLTDEDEVSVVKIKKSIDEGDDVDYSFKLPVPYNVDISNDFVIQVKAYKSGDEDDNCNEDSIAIDLERESNMVILDRAYTSSDEVTCGSYLDLTARIANAGDNDEEDVRFKVYNSELKIDASKTFDLDSTDRETLLFNFLIPENVTAKNYTLNMIIYYDDGDESNSYTHQINVVGTNCKVTPVTTVANQTKEIIFSSLQMSSAFSGSAFMTKVDITNTNNEETTYMIMAKDYSTWATLSGISPSIVTIAPGQVATVYITLVPTADASGTNSFKVSVTSGSITKEQLVTTNIQTSTQSSSLWDQIVFEFNRQWWLFAINFVLLIGIIVLLVVLFKPRKRFPSTEIRLRTAKNGNGNGKRR